MVISAFRLFFVLCFVVSSLGSAIGEPVAQNQTSNEWPEKFALQNVGTGKFLTTSFGGSDQDTGLVQHGTRKLWLSVEDHNVLEGVAHLRTTAGLVVGVPGSSTKERCPLTLQANDDKESQRWKMVRQKDRSIVLKNTHTGLVMTVKDGSAEDFAQVVQVQYSGVAYQRWKVVAPEGEEKARKEPKEPKKK